MLSESDFRQRVMLHFVERAMRKYEERYGHRPDTVNINLLAWGVRGDYHSSHQGVLIVNHMPYGGSPSKRIITSGGNSVYTRNVQSRSGPNEWEEMMVECAILSTDGGNADETG